MSDCDFEAIEAHLRGELDGRAEAAVAAHLARCAACAGELAALRDERALFAARASADPAPPPLAAVLARARRSAAPTRAGVAAVRGAPPPRRAPWATLGVFAAAALAALILRPREGDRPPPAEGAVEIHAEPVACFDDEARASLGPAAALTVGAQTDVSCCDQHAGEPATSTEPCDEADEAPSCSTSGECPVTNSCGSPREGEGDLTP
jgi:anti-sigma factor RsiW